MTIGFITGCSGLKTYHSDLDNNLRLTTQTDSGSVFSNIQAAVDIHKVNKDCSTEYAGSIQLDDSSNDIGIPSGRSSYLVFVFEKSGFFSAETSTTFNTLIRPRNGYQYIAISEPTNSSFAPSWIALVMARTILIMRTIACSMVILLRSE